MSGTKIKDHDLASFSFGFSEADCALIEEQATKEQSRAKVNFFIRLWIL